MKKLAFIAFLVITPLILTSSVAYMYIDKQETEEEPYILPRDHTEEEHMELEELIKDMPIIDDINMDGEHVVESDFFKKAADNVLDESTLTCNDIEYELMMVNEKQDTLELFYKTSSPTDALTDMRVEQYIIYLMLNAIEDGELDKPENNKMVRFQFYYSDNENELPAIDTMTMDIVVLRDMDKLYNYKHLVFSGPDDVKLTFTEDDSDLSIKRFAN